MNPGDKVRVTKRLPSDYPTEGVIIDFTRVLNGTPYYVVQFTSNNQKLGTYSMILDPWDLEPVEPPVDDSFAAHCEGYC